MEKIRFWVVARKAWLLLTARAQYFGLYGLSLYLLLLLPVLLFEPYDPQSTEAPLQPMIVGLVNLTLVVALNISLLHFTIASCRNATSFFGSRPISIYFRYLLASFAVAAIGMIAMIFAGLPAFGVFASGMLENPEMNTPGMILLIVTGLIAFCGGSIPPIRFGAVLPAIAMGDKYSYSRAWQMTKGHSGKLVITMFFILLPSLVLGLVWGFIEGDPAESPMLFNLFNYAVSTLTSVVMMVFFGVLYQDLNERYDAMINPPQAKSDFGFENPDDQ